MYDLLESLNQVSSGSFLISDLILGKVEKLSCKRPGSKAVVDLVSLPEPDPLCVAEYASFGFTRDP